MNISYLIFAGYFSIQYVSNGARRQFWFEISWVKLIETDKWICHLFGNRNLGTFSSIKFVIFNLSILLSKRAVTTIANASLYLYKLLQLLCIPVYLKTFAFHYFAKLVAIVSNLYTDVAAITTSFYFIPF